MTKKRKSPTQPLLDAMRCGSGHHTIQSIRRIAKLAQLRCVSLDYKSSRSRLQFKCTKGHAITMTVAQLRSGNGCRLCAQDERAAVRRPSLEVVRQFARSKGWELVSGEYYSKDEPLQWRCASGHAWYASRHDMQRRGSDCPRCRRTRIAEKRARIPFDGFVEWAADINQAPNTPGCYFLGVERAPGDVVPMYVGETDSLRTRLRTHRRVEHPDMTHARWRPTENEEQARDLQDGYLGVEEFYRQLPWNKVGAANLRGRSQLEVSGGLAGFGGKERRKSRWPIWMRRGR